MRAIAALCVSRASLRRFPVFCTIIICARALLSLVVSQQRGLCLCKFLEISVTTVTLYKVARYLARARCCAAPHNAYQLRRAA